MEHVLHLMTDAIAEILRDNKPSIYLYGSAVMGDFRPGWSDIDLLVLTRKPISPAQAEVLLMLRQTFPIHYPDTKYAHAFEGGMLSLDAFTNHTPDTVVYWGTSGQRITDFHHFDSFSRWELMHCGWLLHGEDVRHLFPLPAPSMLHADVASHARTLLQHGRGSNNLYAFGWLLDIARGLYTLRHDAVISKTAAGEWALAEGLCPVEGALRLALRVRRCPELIRQPEILTQAEALTPAIQAFAKVLCAELNARGTPLPI